MPTFHVQKEEIAAELRKLLNLDNEADLKKVVARVRVQVSGRNLSISFKGTNNYVVGYITNRRNLVSTMGAQNYPNITATLFKLFATELRKIGRFYQNFTEIIDLKKLNFEFSMALLEAVCLIGST